jgi:hypothetical protein
VRDWVIVIPDGPTTEGPAKNRFICNIYDVIDPMQPPGNRAKSQYAAAFLTGNPPSITAFATFAG